MRSVPISRVDLCDFRGLVSLWLFSSRSITASANDWVLGHDACSHLCPCVASTQRYLISVDFQFYFFLLIQTLIVKATLWVPLGASTHSGTMLGVAQSHPTACGGRSEDATGGAGVPAALPAEVVLLTATRGLRVACLLGDCPGVHVREVMSSACEHGSGPSPCHSTGPRRTTVACRIADASCFSMAE